tara:strand:- start:5850 stop:6062 length:213 start_codon:yes stop_codon:yes gene_type:complete
MKLHYKLGSTIKLKFKKPSLIEWLLLLGVVGVLMFKNQETDTRRDSYNGPILWDGVDPEINRRQIELKAR